MATFNLIAGGASIAGLILTIGTLVLAWKIKGRIDEVRQRYVRRIRLREIRSALITEATQLSRCVTTDRLDAGVTTANRINAHLDQLAKHGATLMSPEIERAKTVGRRAVAAGQGMRQASLADLRDELAALLITCESHERDLEWSEPHE